MVPIAIGNGVLRELLIKRWLPEVQARQLSTLILIGLLTVYVWAVQRVWPLESGRQALAVGALWVVLTLAFEFALGRFVSHLSWQQILADYDVSAGRIWLLVPLWVAAAPYVFFRAQQ